MSINAQKTPLGRSLNDFAQRKVAEAIWQTGRALPCSAVSADGALITVKFEVQSGFTLPQITVPLFGPRYIRYPIAEGDAGVVIAADAQLGAVSGQTSGASNLAAPANLGALFFVPLGNKGWPDVDPDAVTLTAPNGVVLQDDTGASTFVLTPTSITMGHGGNTIVINATGVFINGRQFLLHEHSGVQTGSGNSGGVV